MVRNLLFLFSLSFDLSLSIRHQKVIKWQLLLFQMMKFSLIRSHYSLNTHFEWEKLSLDDFLMSKSKKSRAKEKEKKNLGLNHDHLSPFYILYNVQWYASTKCRWSNFFVLQGCIHRWHPQNNFSRCRLKGWVTSQLCHNLQFALA